MGWSSWRWFLAGYAVGPLVAFWLGGRPPGPLVLAPVMMWILAPVGLLQGALWTGQPQFMRWMMGLVLLVSVSLWLEKRGRILDSADDTLPVARAVTARRAYLFPTSTWSQLIGHILLAIVGAALPYVGGLGLS